MSRHEHLEKLQKVTKEILAELRASSDKDSIKGAINWADLNCTEARYIENVWLCAFS